MGRQSIYRSAVPESDDLLKKAAETVLARTGDAVALCRRYWPGDGAVSELDPREGGRQVAGAGQMSLAEQSSSQATIGYTVVDGVIAVTFGLIAGSTALTGFGFDS